MNKQPKLPYDFFVMARSALISALLNHQKKIDEYRIHVDIMTRKKKIVVNLA